MPNYMDYNVLDVGQGSGNFIEYRDVTSNALLNTILIDLGSERAPKTTAGGPSVEFVVATLQEMTQPTIDVLIFSHSDSDHINLIVDVLDAFYPYGTPNEPANATLLIKKVWYGGDYGRYTKRGKNILNTVQDYMEDADEDMDGVDPLGTSFTHGDQSDPLCSVGDMEVYLLIGNVANAAVSNGPKKKKARMDSYSVNANSLVIMVQFGGVQLVATGDATGTTLVECNSVLEEEDVRNTFFYDVFMVTMPHHGSATTTFDIRGYDGSAEDNLQLFADTLNSDTITASAERVRTFKHPSALVMEYFWKTVVTKTFWSDTDFLTNERHFYTAYFTGGEEYTSDESGMAEDFPDEAWWYTVATSQNIYTNLYYEFDMQAGLVLPPKAGISIPKLKNKAPQPPLGTAWCYRVQADGTKKLLRMINRPSLMALRRAILDGVPPEDLPVPTRAERHAEAAAMDSLQATQLGLSRRNPTVLHAPSASLPSVASAPAASAPAKRNTAGPAAPRGLKVLP